MALREYQSDNTLKAQLDAGRLSDIQLDMPTPYALQYEIMHHPAIYKVVIAGRRVGKTITAGMVGSNYFLQGKSVLIVSTTAEQAKAFWNYIRLWMTPLVDAGIVYKNDSGHYMTYHTSDGKMGYIKARTGSNPNVLRGGAVDLLIIDEAAYLKEETWDKVGIPMLLDREGQVMFLSSPLRKNWLYRLYLKGRDEQQTKWKSWNFPTTANPHLSKARLAELSEDMTEESYRQEILAEFLDSEGAVFGNLERVISLDLLPNRDAGVYQVAQPYAGRFVAGVDWGQDRDFTVVSILDMVTGNVVHIERFNKLPWVVMRERVKGIFRAWGVHHAIVEVNSIGKPQFEALLAERVPVSGFFTSAESKATLIQSLQLEFERNSIHLPNHPTVRGEFEVFERIQSKRSFRSSYSAPPDSHDDIVISVALANHARYNTSASTDVW